MHLTLIISDATIPEIRKGLDLETRVVSHVVFDNGLVVVVDDDHDIICQ